MADKHKEQKEYTAQEVAAHDRPATGVWVTHEGKVFDITDFIPDHPGGDIIFDAAGQDIAPYWETYLHLDDAHELLESLQVGTLKKADQLQVDKTLDEGSKEKYIRTSLLNLQRFHDELTPRFARHQELILAGDLTTALKMLKLYNEQIRIHMQEEEMYIVPNYRKHSPMPADQRDSLAKLYPTEHERMRGLLEEAIVMLEKLVEQEDEPHPQQILGLLDRESHFKTIIHAHDERELRDLYPGAGWDVSDEERNAIWEDCFRVRQEMGFCLGDIFPLQARPHKIELVKECWNLLKGSFEECLADVLQQCGRPLPLQPSSPKQARLLIDDILSCIEGLDKKARAELRKRHLPQSFGYEHADAVRDALVATLEKAASRQKPPSAWTPELREAWSNVLNVVLSPGDNVIEPIHQQMEFRWDRMEKEAQQRAESRVLLQ